MNFMILFISSQIFEPYGCHWFPCITDLILSGEIKGTPLNYYVVDLVVVMLSWSKTCIPEDTVVARNMASSLLEYLIKHSHHTNRAVLKNNLQIVKTLLQVWKERLEVPYKLVYGLFSNPHIEAKDNSTGLQFLGLIIKAGFPPFSTTAGLSKDEFFTSLTNCLHFKYKEVYATASEVCGLALKHFEEQHDENGLSYLLEIVSIELSKHSRTYKEQFVLCIFHMHSYYPNIVDRLVFFPLFLHSCIL